MAKCRFCGTDGGEFGLREINGYDWNSDDDTALSTTRINHECANVSGCASRIIEQGRNPDGLMMVIENGEYLGSEMVAQAREILREWSAILVH